MSDTNWLGQGMNEPSEMDWLLHITRGHTPTEKWNKRNSIEHYFSAHSDERLIYHAPMFRDEVVRLREAIKAYLNLEIETHELKEMIE